MKIHLESINELCEIVEDVGFKVSSSTDRDDLTQVVTCSGAIINWYPTTGTISFQGKEPAKNELAVLIKSFLQDTGDMPLTF